MKKQRFSLLLLLTIGLVIFTLGFFLGRNGGRGDVILSVPVSMHTAPAEAASPLSRESTSDTVGRVNLNTATKEELMTLPGIGQTYAEHIVDYREKYGSFSSVDQLLNVPGIGKKRLESILDLITIGGNP